MDVTKLQQGFNQEIRVMKRMDHQIVMNPNNNPTPTCATSTTRPNSTGLEKKTRPQEQLNCPRCNSTNTKFCYYNNYSLTQPRYICKTCRRYWTEGGSLRNVPVGGGSRRNRKSNILSSSSSTTRTKISSSSSSSSNPSTASKTDLPDLNPPFLFSNHQNPKTQKDQDLNLAFPSMREGGQGQYCNFPQYLQMPKTGINHPNSTSSLELLRTGIASRGMDCNFIPAPVLESNAAFNPSGFSFQQEYKPSLGFSIDGFENRTGVPGEVQENLINGGRVLFPFGDMKQLIPSAANEVEDHQQNIKRQSNASNEFWNGMLGGGGPSW